MYLLQPNTYNETIETTVSVPSGFTVHFHEGNLTNLEPNEEKTFNITINATEGMILSTHMVTLTAEVIYANGVHQSK